MLRPPEQACGFRNRVKWQLRQAVLGERFFDQPGQKMREQDRRLRRLPQKESERSGTGIYFVEPDLSGLRIAQEIDARSPGSADCHKRPFGAAANLAFEFGRKRRIKIAGEREHTL